MASTGNDRWEGLVPGQTTGARIQFYITATDGAGAGAFFPARGPDSRAMYQVNDGLASTSQLHTFRIIVTPADRDWMYTNINAMSDDRIPCTIIYRESEVFYDAGVRLKGSERARTQQARIGWNVEFNPGQLFRGAHRTVSVDRSEGVGTGQIEVLFNHMMYAAGGVSGKYHDLVKVISPRPEHNGFAELQLARYGQMFLESQFEDGEKGSLFEYELIYYPTTANASGYKIPEPDGVVGTSFRNLGNDKEAYRWTFLLKNNRANDDFSALISYCKHFDLSGANFHAAVERYVDVDLWLRGMAFAVLSGAGDNFGANDQHNGMFYARPDGRLIFLPHDMDFAFDASRSIFSNTDLTTITSDQARRRQYLGHLHDIITTTYNNSYMSRWTAHYGSLLPGQNFASHLSYMTSRSNNVLNQIRSSVPMVDFTLTTNGGAPLTVSNSPVTLNGDGWVNVRTIRLAGGPPLDVRWTDSNSWQVQVPVAPGVNNVMLEAVDFGGNVVGTRTIQITNTEPVDPASAANIVVSEFSYHPADPTTAEVAAGFADADEFEFIELKNIGPRTVDLTGAQFTGGIAFAFPAATTIAPGGHVVVPRRKTAFSARYPSVPAAALVGEFFASVSNNLANGGEELLLVAANGADIKRFRYDDEPPWPDAADGAGFSLVLIDPDANPDHNVAGNWRTSVATGGNPAGTDVTGFTAWMGLHGETDPASDSDHDGWPAVFEYVLGGDPQSPGSDMSVGIEFDEFGPTLTFQRRTGTDDVALTVESSLDLITWAAIPTDRVLTIRDPGSDTELITVRVPPSASQSHAQFLRLRVAQ
jgi:hypothetical protein